MTGRGAGFCAGFGMPGYANPMQGRGFGMGFGRGGGRRNRFFARGFMGRAFYGASPANRDFEPRYSEPNPEMQKQALKMEAENLQAELEFIRKRLSELESAVKPD